MMDEIESPYRTQSIESHFQVADETGRAVLDCGSASSAEQYAALLNQAFRRGFKAGYRAAKRASNSSSPRA